MDLTKMVVSLPRRQPWAAASRWPRGEPARGAAPGGRRRRGNASASARGRVGSHKTAHGGLWGCRPPPNPHPPSPSRRCCRRSPRTGWWVTGTNPTRTTGASTRSRPPAAPGPAAPLLPLPSAQHSGVWAFALLGRELNSLRRLVEGNRLSSVNKLSFNEN